MAGTIRKLTSNLLFLCAMILGTLIALEGSSSLVLFSGSLFAKGGEAARRHTQYDEVLGWVNVPNLTVQDMYGPGVFLRTNAQGFRGTRNIGVDVPNGKIRVVCSGDSFTLGYGVDDDHTWCQLLASLDQRIEPVNMGQGGYGIDQAFLWYKRVASTLKYDIHIFAFIADDFHRMEASEFSSYAKPILDLDGGRLVVKNVPVPRRRWYATPAAHFAPAFRKLRSYELARRAMRRVGPPQTVGSEDVSDHTWDVALGVFETLHEMNAARQSALVLVYLPAKWDYEYSGGPTEIRRRRLADESKKRGWAFVDLVHEIRQLAPEQAEEMFSPVHLHYTVAGNNWVAQMLYRRISALPQFSRPVPGGN